MMQRTLEVNIDEGLHVGIIMDGNGRWALSRGQPRSRGHRAGAGAVRRTVEAARDLGIRTLTLYAFSSSNWERPSREVAALMKLFGSYLRAETSRCVQHGIRVSVIGRRGRLSPSLLASIRAAETATLCCRDFRLRIAIDYSSREAIVRAAELHSFRRELDREEFSRLLARALHSDMPCQNVDLIIRTGGEQRLSDFLLWESAYAELWFTSRMWPDFGRADLESAIEWFHRRDRRFGRIPGAACG